MSDLKFPQQISIYFNFTIIFWVCLTVKSIKKNEYTQLILQIINLIYAEDGRTPITLRTVQLQKKWLEELLLEKQIIENSIQETSLEHFISLVIEKLCIPKCENYVEEIKEYSQDLEAEFLTIKTLFEYDDGKKHIPGDFIDRYRTLLRNEEELILLQIDIRYIAMLILKHESAGYYDALLQIREKIPIELFKSRFEVSLGKNQKINSVKDNEYRLIKKFKDGLPKNKWFSETFEDILVNVTQLYHKDRLFREYLDNRFK